MTILPLVYMSMYVVLYVGDRRKTLSPLHVLMHQCECFLFWMNYFKVLKHFLLNLRPAVNERVVGQISGSIIIAWWQQQCIAMSFQNEVAKWSYKWNTFSQLFMADSKVSKICQGSFTVADDSKVSNICSDRTLQIQQELPSLDFTYSLRQNI
jgi:hypothetical protein